jgi:hypothetical protein
MTPELSTVGLLLAVITGLFSVLWWVTKNWMKGVDEKIEVIREREQKCQNEETELRQCFGKETGGCRVDFCSVSSVNRLGSTI